MTPNNLPSPKPRVTSEILDRMPPQSVQSEEQLIGCILLLPKCLDEVALAVRENDFYADANRKLYRHLLAMYDQNRAIDASLLVERLKSSGDLESVGGVSHVAKCAQSVPFAAHAIHYAELIAEKAKLRACIHAGMEMLHSAWEPGASSQDVVDACERSLAEVATHRASRDVVTAAEAAEAFTLRMDQIIDRKRRGGIATGIQRFDEQIGGLFEGELSFLAARPSVGKTALACNIAEHNAKRGRLVYFVSLEMTPDELAGRTICSLADVSGRVMRTGEFNEGDTAKLATAANEFAELPIRIDCRTEVKVYDIRRTARRLSREGLRLVVIDYLQLIEPDNPRDVREQQVAKISRRLKQMANELKIPVLCLAQLNRATEQQQRPSKANLRESGALEQDGDMVMLLHRPDGGIVEKERGEENGRTKWLDVVRPWPAELILDKNRKGETGVFTLDWEPQITRFSCFDSKATNMPNYEPAFDQGGF